MNWAIIILLGFSTIHLNSGADEENIIVITPLGKIMGSTLESRLGRTIFSYRGIRYAKAPVGELRFKVRLF